MTRRIPPNNQGRRALCYALGIHFIVSSAAYAFEQKGIPMNKAPATMTIWQTIAQLTQQISFSEEKVEERVMGSAAWRWGGWRGEMQCRWLHALDSCASCGAISCAM